ncbi:hypothetical protein [Nocardiopsis sp. CNT312]|uniref:hypothetical protein n=1 Tax=Nocardiopsis sp. CNT312 TaxID=1137268 RepID=UPI0012DEF558|nr:hypothetical protein [Nocardiopsis sp. CNT312]
MKRSVPRVGALLLASTLFFSTSSSTGASMHTPTKPGLTSLGEAHGNSEISSGMSAHIHSAERNGSGKLLSLTWSIENESGRADLITWIRSRHYTYTGPYYSGIALVDDNYRRFHPLRDSDGSCVCSGATSSNFKSYVRLNEQATYWSLYSIPEDIETVTVEITGFEPIEDIPIS